MQTFLGKYKRPNLVLFSIEDFTFPIYGFLLSSYMVLTSFSTHSSCFPNTHSHLHFYKIMTPSYTDSVSSNKPISLPIFEWFGWYMYILKLQKDFSS